MVRWIFDCVTLGLSTPGVQVWSGFPLCAAQCAGTVDATVAPPAAAARANAPAAAIPASRFLAERFGFGLPAFGRALIDLLQQERRSRLGGPTLGD